MKKIFCTLISALLLSAACFALPGFDSYLGDNAGRYVYYQDKSFNRESYIGILMYDDSTFQIRYYAPENDENYLPSKEISLLFTINPDADYLELTGERIISSIMPDTEDVDIVNYLHDFLYDFSSRRSKIDLDPAREDYVLHQDFYQNGLKVQQEYEQFGGAVTICYDCVVPFFNIKSITASDGSVVLDTCLIGQISSAQDKSFENFKGFNAYGKSEKDTDDSKVQVYKKSKAKKYNCNDQTITLDKNWEELEDLPGVYILNNDAVITMASLSAAEGQDDLKNELYVLRGYLTSSSSSYSNLQNCELNYNQKKESYKVLLNTYLNEENSFVTKTNIITKSNQNNYYVFTLSIYKKSLLKNQSYFTKILKTYSVK